MNFKEKAIKNIIENFDFEKVHKVMVFLDWTWLHDVEPPSMGSLVISAQQKLSDTFDMCNNKKKDISIGSGGFVVYAEYNQQSDCCDYLDLKFQITSCEYYEDWN
jgi:hypothetical protein